MNIGIIGAGGIARTMAEGCAECREMPHSETIKMMRLMDSIRARFGIKYPMEQWPFAGQRC